MKIIFNEITTTGLSGKIKIVPFFTDEPKFPNYFCEPNEKAMELYKTEGTFGQGYDTNVIKAKIKAVGEMLERLCLSNPSENFLETTYENSSKFLDPGLFFCYSSEQTKNKQEKIKNIRNGKYKWVKSKNFATKEDIYVPAQMIFLSNDFSDEYALRKEQISTGAALGKIGELRAFQSGFFEVIERDGIMGFYLQNLQGRKMNNFPQKINKLLDYLNRYNLETHIFNATTDLEIPTIFTLTIDRSGVGDAINVGSKSGLTYIESIQSSIMESIQCRRLARGAKSFNQQKEINSENEIHSLENRFDYWSNPKKIKDLDYLINETPTISYQKLNPKTISFDQAINNVKNKGFNILVTDITLPEIKQQGFETLKVTIPELHPLYLDERAKALYSVHFGEIKELKLKPHPVT
jgi:ribosomal protein S12 methylthiotransferase accessory factor